MALSHRRPVAINKHLDGEAANNPPSLLGTKENQLEAGPG